MDDSVSVNFQNRGYITEEPTTGPSMYLSAEVLASLPSAVIRLHTPPASAIVPMPRYKAMPSVRQIAPCPEPQGPPTAAGVPEPQAVHSAPASSNKVHAVSKAAQWMDAAGPLASVSPAAANEWAAWMGGACPAATPAPAVPVAGPPPVPKTAGTPASVPAQGFGSPAAGGKGKGRYRQQEAREPSFCSGTVSGFKLIVQNLYFPRDTAAASQIRGWLYRDAGLSPVDVSLNYPTTSGTAQVFITFLTFQQCELAYDVCRHWETPYPEVVGGARELGKAHCIFYSH
jgi:hypothetical protein